MLIVYRKDNGNVIYYDNYNSDIKPTLQGVYDMNIRYNHPELSIQDIDEKIISDKEKDDDGFTLKSKLLKYSFYTKFVNDKFQFDTPPPLSEPIENPEQKKIKQIQDLEDTVAKQQQIIEMLAQKIGVKV